MLEAGAQAVLVTGGDLVDDSGTDVLVETSGATRFQGSRIDSPHTHGTGCILTASIATKLARGHDLVRAIELAKEFVGDSIRHGRALGRGIGPVDPMFGVHQRRMGAKKGSRDVD